MEANKMNAGVKTYIEETFLSLPREEREAIISHGTALRLSNLRKRLFLAESKGRHFEEKYRATLAQLDADGLPDDADYEMHEDYIMARKYKSHQGKRVDRQFAGETSC
jgi:hypothetical protein